MSRMRAIMEEVRNTGTFEVLGKVKTLKDSHLGVHGRNYVAKGLGEKEGG
jgi:hypothetical protein